MDRDDGSQYTLTELRNSFLDDKSAFPTRDSKLRKLQTLSSRLASREDRQPQSSGAENAQVLSLKVAELILPRSDVVRYDDAMDETPSTSRISAIAATKELAFHGLTVISHLSAYVPSNVVMNPAVLISIVTYTNPLDPWTDTRTISLANDLLARSSVQIHNPSFIITDILTNFVRPLFLKSKRIESITSTGRKAMPTSAPPTRYDAALELDHANQPWRYKTVYAVTVLGWAVANISPNDIKPNLHLILPPVLHLLDTSSHALRHRGLLMLPSFFAKLTPQLLTQTGLGSVFEDAITPTLMYLPTLTPIIESELLVSAAWDALFALHNIWFTESSTPEKTSRLTLTTTGKAQNGVSSEKQRVSFLLKHLRDDLLQAWSYTYPSHPSILALLLRTLSKVIPKLGIHATKHLKDIIPIVSCILLDPFVMGTSEGRSMVREAIGALRETILACWMRIAGDAGRRREVLRILVGTWRSVSDREDEEDVEKELESIKKELIIVASLFVRAGEAGEQNDIEAFQGDLRRLKDTDDGMNSLFGTPVNETKT